MNNNSERQLLEPGWGYAQVQKVEDKRLDGTPLVSKKGSPMIKLTLFVTDSMGHTGFVSDWITSETNWKIDNVEDAFQIKGLYENGKFKKELLVGKCTACSLATQQREGYGPVNQLKLYIPLSFAELVNAPITDSPKEPISWKAPLREESNKVTDSIEDDIPF